MVEKKFGTISKSKVWLEKDDNVVYGDGRQALLKAIAETGSIRQAASRLGMSYRAAWGKIKATEERLGIDLVSKRAGGSDSGTSLTDAGRDFMRRYDEFKAESNKAVDELHKKYFG